MREWVTLFGFFRRRRESVYNSRGYFALREAQALRLQFGPEAEQACRDKLAHPDTSARQARFLRLVLQSLRNV